MNQNKDFEFVSAAMDDDDLSDEMLDKLLSDSEAQQKWHEYHVIGDYMRYAKSVSGAGANTNDMATEKHIAANHMNNGKSQHIHKPEMIENKAAANQAFYGFAVVASVLAVAVGVWQFWPSSRIDSGAAVVQKNAPADNLGEGIVPVGSQSDSAKTDPVANAEAQGAVVPNAARENQTNTVEKQSAVRVEKIPGQSASDSMN
ncbi:sigma-E factor negative regulatory protein [Neisseria montereyensis]|uniref:Sigma-E factor negative regulatory protein n=1 Tax=Neisseria montereyensis TaxID=2973938 RepID=A0ABT2FCW9_9NEIS|nr:sigma-E factor negative regulatory protein [Neisseria montereyensis]MCS4533400.1 sigma-E factor negative regulatory protein [Neisseria montereyensis]